ncbi:glutathione S-transferase family protein [Hyphobacterium sp.]|uniref:glutathione S-transferase family protein n=1 Tax=Hyphobacterium sp. TaxID=2004662 RepID=UPI003BA921DB
MNVILHIGNKRLSSWSMRPWLALKQAGVEFEENLVPLDVPVTREQLAEISPVGTVPVLEIDGQKIWDSLAICEWAAEQSPSLWPKDASLRATARAVTATMHSGYAALRATLPMDLQRPKGATGMGVACWADIEAVEKLWSEVKTGEGPYLFGDWSIADAFFTPVATRFDTYQVPISETSQAYVDTLLNDAHYQDWLAGAKDEPFPALGDA